MAVLEKIRQNLGLNAPLWHQYLDYFGRIFHGNLGYSYVSDEPVTTIITHALPVDLSLAIPAGIIWLSVGLGLGSFAARHSTSVGARTATVFVLAGLSIPTFMLGIALVYLFGGIWIPGLDLFPRPGNSWTPFLVSPLEWAHGLILPWITLAFISSATYVRLSRSSMREVLGEDFVQAVLSQDRPVVQGVVLATSAFIVVANIVVDGLYGVIDPRVRVS